MSPLDNLVATVIVQCPPPSDWAPAGVHSLTPSWVTTTLLSSQGPGGHSRTLDLVWGGQPNLQGEGLTEPKATNKAQEPPGGNSGNPRPLIGFGCD